MAEGDRYSDAQGFIKARLVEDTYDQQCYVHIKTELVSFE